MGMNIIFLVPGFDSEVGVGGCTKGAFRAILGKVSRDVGLR